MHLLRGVRALRICPCRLGNHATDVNRSTWSYARSIRCYSDHTAPVTGTTHSSRKASTESSSGRMRGASVDEAELRKFSRYAGPQYWWRSEEMQPLRAMNQLRIPLIRDGLIEKQYTEEGYPSGPQPLLGLQAVDVGCGGGIVCEPLARLGMKMVGLDPVAENISAAEDHLMASREGDLMERINYVNDTIENFASQPSNQEKFDAVIASEVLEHVARVEPFLKACLQILKPGGKLFLTTINQTPAAYLLAILAAENIFSIVPPGTHEYAKLVSPEALKLLLETELGCLVLKTRGMCFNPITGRWSWIDSTQINYAMHVEKLISLKESSNTSSLHPERGSSSKISGSHIDTTTKVLYEQRRYLAKGKSKPKAGGKHKGQRPSADLDEDEMMLVIPIDSYKEQMNDIKENLRIEFVERITTRTASIALEGLMVEIEEEKVPLKEIAQMSRKSPTLIVLNMSQFPDAIKPAMKAINDSGTGLSPQQEGTMIYVQVPKVTREFREQLAKNVKAVTTRAKEDLRKLQGKFLSAASKKKGKTGTGVSDDIVYQTIEHLKYMTNETIAEMDRMADAKIKDILAES